jgi:hypothetical protein
MALAQIESIYFEKQKGVGRPQRAVRCFFFVLRRMTNISRDMSRDHQILSVPKPIMRRITLAYQKNNFYNF